MLRMLDLLQAQPFDLAILDMHMPGLDGDMLARRIRDAGHGVGDQRPQLLGQHRRRADPGERSGPGTSVS